MMSISWLEDRVEELKAALVFCTRLPLFRAMPVAGAALGKAAWAFPLAGLVVGLIGAAVYALAHRFGLPAWPAAVLAVAATLLVTGALHEDGLADTADGFGGGNSREQKLAIMRDSRIGTYGVCALTVALLLRVAALASLPSAHAVVWALIAAHVAARATMPALMLMLPPARSDGLSHDAGQPAGASAAAAAAIGFVVLALLPASRPRHCGADPARRDRGADGWLASATDRRPDRRRGGRAGAGKRDRRVAGGARLAARQRR